MLARAACKIDQFWVANCTAARRASSDADQDAASRIAARLAGSLTAALGCPGAVLIALLPATR